MGKAGTGVTAIVLAGGEGSRMGLPKAQLTFRGQPLLHRVVRTVAQAADEVLVVSAPSQVLDLPDEVSVTVVTDREQARGPLMGLYSGLDASSHELNMAVACDMPFLDPRLLRALCDLAKGHDAVVPVVAGRLQPLHAVYRRGCLDAIERLLDRGVYRMSALADAVHSHRAVEQDWASFSPDARTFLSVNTPQELARAERME